MQLPAVDRAARPRPLAEQTVVITGASSGIGRAAARAFAQRGARVVLAARDEPALEDLATELRAGTPGDAFAVPTDVSDAEQVRELARRAAERYGGIDTWINNAAVALYGNFEDLALEEFQRVIDVNFMGSVYGARAALPYLRERGAGTLIFVGSVLSDRAIPLQGAYCAAKHALKAFSESLRVELEHEGANVQVTLVKPSSINTPFFDSARTKMGYRPRPVDPIYSPELVADVLVHCAEHREREVVVGGGGKLLTTMETFAGPLLDAVLARSGYQNQQTEEPKSADAPDNLFVPLHDERHTSSNFPARRFSTYTWARLHSALVLGAAAALAGALFARRARQHPA